MALIDIFTASDYMIVFTTAEPKRVQRELGEHPLTFSGITDDTVPRHVGTLHVDDPERMNEVRAKIDELNTFFRPA